MRRRGIGRTEVIIGIAVVVVLLLIAVPLVTGTSDDAKRAELALNVDAIRTAEVMNKEAFDDYISAEPAPRPPEAVGPEPVAWAPSKGFESLNWEPTDTEAVYGSYWVSASADGFTVTGVADIDGDGRRSEWRATATEPAKQVSEEDVY